MHCPTCGVPNTTGDYCPKPKTCRADAENYHYSEIIRADTEHDRLVQKRLGRGVVLNEGIESQACANFL